MATYFRYTMDEVTTQVNQCRLIGLMIEDCAGMVDLAEQHGNLPTMLPKMETMLDHLKMLADDAREDLLFMVWETSSFSPEERRQREVDDAEQGDL